MRKVNQSLLKSMNLNFFTDNIIEGSGVKVIGFLEPLNEKLEIVYCVKFQIEKEGL